MYRIVCIQPGRLASIKEGWLFEVPENYIIRNRTFPGITALQNCIDLDDVRQLVSDVGNSNFRFVGETLDDLLKNLRILNSNDEWYERRPDIHIYQTGSGFEAMVYLDAPLESEEVM